jgi:hypothetical protein
VIYSWFMIHRCICFTSINIYTCNTPIMKYLSNSPTCSFVSQSSFLILRIVNLSNSTNIIMTALIRPNQPISRAIASSFSWRGVTSGSLYRSKDIILPEAEESPTTMIKKNPSPVITFINYSALFKKKNTLFSINICRLVNN